jgi:hypothetical protein
MTENFLFKALVVSLAAHTAVLWAAYLSRINDPHYKAIRQNRVEISYKPVRKKAADIREYPIRPAQSLDLSNNQKLFSEGTVPVALVKERLMMPFGIASKLKPEHMRDMELSRKVSIRPVLSQKINNPVYTVYSQMVRDRIEEKAYQNYDKMEAGFVYLSFVLDDHGVLKDAQIIPEKTSASEHLQEIAIKSLRDASPFPAFLKGMTLWEYPFEIEIQYRVND